MRTSGHFRANDGQASGWRFVGPGYKSVHDVDVVYCLCFLSRVCNEKHEILLQEDPTERLTVESNFTNKFPLKIIRRNPYTETACQGEPAHAGLLQTRGLCRGPAGWAMIKAHTFWGGIRHLAVLVCRSILSVLCSFLHDHCLASLVAMLHTTTPLHVCTSLLHE